MTGTWLEQVVARGVVDTARACGIHADDRHLQRCPACGAERRGRHDRRAPCNVTSRGQGWRCHVSGCEAHGDAVTLVSYVATGEAKPSDWSAVRAHAQRVGLVGEDAPSPAPAPTRPRAAPRPGKAFDVPAASTSIASALWDGCWPVTACDAATRAVRDRGVDPSAVVVLDLARARPPQEEVEHDVAERMGIAGVDALDEVQAARHGLAPEAWARGAWRTWGQPYRLVLPTYSPTGDVCGLRGRAPRGEHYGRVKALPTTPAGGVMACPVAQWVLRSGPRLRRGTHQIPRGAGAVSWSGWVVIREGEGSYLARAALEEPHPTTGHHAAVLGVYAGAWTRDHADRIPRWCEVVIATDDDEAGRKFARDIAETLTARGIRPRRYLPPTDIDDEDATT